MADKVVPGPVEGSAAVREAVCIHTRKIFDACRDKDCVEDLRVYPTVSSQTKLDSALSVRPRSAELLCADVRVKEIKMCIRDSPGTGRSPSPRPRRQCPSSGSRAGRR